MFYYYYLLINLTHISYMESNYIYVKNMEDVIIIDY